MTDIPTTAAACADGVGVGDVGDVGDVDVAVLLAGSGCQVHHVTDAPYNFDPTVYARVLSFLDCPDALSADSPPAHVTATMLLDGATFPGPGDEVLIATGHRTTTIVRAPVWAQDLRVTEHRRRDEDDRPLRSRHAVEVRVTDPDGTQRWVQLLTPLESPFADSLSALPYLHQHGDPDDGSLDVYLVHMFIAEIVVGQTTSSQPASGEPEPR